MVLLTSQGFHRLTMHSRIHNLPQTTHGVCNCPVPKNKDGLSQVLPGPVRAPSLLEGDPGFRNELRDANLSCSTPGD